MADEEHVKILKKGVEVWNKWREENPDIKPDLSRANLTQSHLSGVELSYADLSAADLRESDLSGAKFSIGIDWTEANLSGAILKKVDLNGARLSGINLRDAKLHGANLRRANLTRADLSGAMLKNADLREASLNGAVLIRTKLDGANLSDCKVYGISAWDLSLKETTQNNLSIAPRVRAKIRLDNLELAQFIYLLLKNEKIRGLIDTITTKVVLILGRFTKERKIVLDAIRNQLRKSGYIAVLFDFEKPTSRDLTETISTLAHMARFIIADITDAKSIPQELQTIVPNLPSVPIQPLLLGSATEYGMFEHFRRYPWVLEICRYHDPDELIQSIQTKVIAPAEEKAKALMKAKNG